MDNQINKSLISDYIKKNNLTISEFCQKCNISQSTFHNIMNNSLDFNVDVLLKLARLLNIEIYQLFI